ncbi:MAG: TonB-dependent receptor [Chitinophagaceae bacterium]|nr:TonB-dependent receptor [Chitinophagaceae bacterium]MCW5925796.1 TonB-dependent receptor [Chitinophagaceae bacterium]
MNVRILVLTLLLLNTAAHAQTDSTNPTSLNEIVVTATRFAKKVSETGKVITVIGKQEIERSAGKDLSQVLNEQAGLIVNSANSNPGKDKSIFLRGAKPDYTIVLLNGIPVSDPSTAGGAFDIRMFPLEQVERIEILKGAQSTLYGSDAIAGVINIITKKPLEKPFQAYGTISAGSYNTWKLNAGVNGSAEKASYNIGFTHYKTNGISEAEDTTTAKIFDKDGFLQNAFNSDFDIAIAKGLHLKPYFRYSYFKGNYDDGAYTDGVGKYQAQLLTTGTQLQYRFNSGSVTAFYDYDEIDRNFADDFGAYPYAGTKKTLELFGNYAVGKYVQLLGGIHYNKQKMKDAGATPANPTAELTSPYIAFFLKDLGGFNLELGGRYNKHSTYGDNFTYSLNPSYTIANNVKLFANYATAFKAPSLSSLFGPWGSNPDLKPETSATLEGGLQTSLVSGILDLRAVYFSRTIKNIIISGPAYQLMNLDEQNDHGIEIEPTLYLGKKLSLRLFYAYVNGDVTTESNGKDSTYFNLIRRPKHSVGANLGYQVTKKFFISTQFYSYAKRSDLYFDMSTFTNQAVNLPAYSVWNAYAEYAPSGCIKLFADAKNLAGARYNEVYGYSAQRLNITGGIRLLL